jgi:hypothetical protein
MDTIIELALQSGKQFQSSQTGFVHYNYQNPLKGTQDTIPVYENFLFALALLRSRIGDHIQEAKQLIKQLLPFQNHLTSPGNFPVYLHQYPHCADSTLPINLLTPLYWILKNYSSVLGTTLQKNLQDATMQTLRYSIHLFEEKPTLPDYLGIKIASATEAFSSLFKVNLWERFGKTSKEGIEVETTLNTWYTPELLGEILPALQMIDPQLSSSKFALLKSFLKTTWSSKLNSYIGPSYREYFEGEHPDVTLFHLWMFQTTQKFPKLSPHPKHLKSALVQNVKQWEIKDSIPTLYKEDEWTLYKGTQIAVTALPKESGHTPPFQKALHPLKIIWEHEGSPASFVCYGGDSKVEYRLSPPQVELIFTLPSELPETKRVKNSYETQFFFSALPNITPLVNDSKATFFTLDDTVTIKAPKATLKLEFHPLTEEMHCVGHLMQMNRPSQKKENIEFKAYDWGIVLRTIKRKPQSHLRVTITWIEHIDEK